MPRRRVSPDIPETQIGSQNTQPSRARILHDLLVTGSPHTNVPNVDRLVIEIGDHPSYSAWKIGVDDESQTDSGCR